MNSVADRSVVITGASRGIGAAAARHLAALGARVVLLARDAAAIERIAAEIVAAGGVAVAHPGDVARFADMQAAVDRAIALHGRIDALINNAGVIDPIAHIADSDPEAWGAVIDVNVKGVYHGLRAALPAMLAQGAGTVVTISSGAATSALEGWSHYCASKAAALALTRCAHLEYGAHGVRVLGLSPGTVATDMQRAIRASGLNPVSRIPFESHIPPEWVAQAIAYLLDPASDAHLGTDFALRSEANRKAVGLPPPQG